MYGSLPYVNNCKWDLALLFKKKKAEPVARKKSKTQEGKGDTGGPAGKEAEPEGNGENDS